jgi:hypothetical protein
MSPFGFVFLSSLYIYIDEAAGTILGHPTINPLKYEMPGSPLLYSQVINYPSRTVYRLVQNLS